MVASACIILNNHLVKIVDFFICSVKGDVLGYLNEFITQSFNLAEVFTNNPGTSSVLSFYFTLWIVWLNHSAVISYIFRSLKLYSNSSGILSIVSSERWWGSAASYGRSRTKYGGWHSGTWICRWCRGATGKKSVRLWELAGLVRQINYNLVFFHVGRWLVECCVVLDIFGEIRAKNRAFTALM